MLAWARLLLLIVLIRPATSLKIASSSVSDLGSLSLQQSANAVIKRHAQMEKVVMKRHAKAKRKVEKRAAANAQVAALSQKASEVVRALVGVHDFKLGQPVEVTSQAGPYYRYASTFDGQDVEQPIDCEVWLEPGMKGTVIKTRSPDFPDDEWCTVQLKIPDTCLGAVFTVEPGSLRYDCCVGGFTIGDKVEVLVALSDLSKRKTPVKIGDRGEIVGDAPSDKYPLKVRFGKHEWRVGVNEIQRFTEAMTEDKLREALKKDIAAQKAKQDQLKQKTQALQLDLEKKQKAIQAQEEKYHKALLEERKRQTELAKQQSDLKQKNAGLAQQHGDLKQKNAGLAQQNNELAKQHGDLKQKNAGLAQQNNALKQQHEDLKRTSDEQKNALKKQNEGLTQQHDALKKKNEGLTQDHDALKQQHDDLKRTSDENAKKKQAEFDAKMAKQKSDFEAQLQQIDEEKNKLMLEKMKRDHAAEQAAKDQAELENLKNVMAQRERDKEKEELEKQRKMDMAKDTPRGLELSMAKNFGICTQLDINIASGLGVHIALSGEIVFEKSKSFTKGAETLGEAWKIHFKGMLGGGLSLSAIFLKASVYLQGTFDVIASAPSFVRDKYTALKWVLKRLWDAARPVTTRMSNFFHTFLCGPKCEKFKTAVKDAWSRFRKDSRTCEERELFDKKVHQTVEAMAELKKDANFKGDLDYLLKTWKDKFQIIRDTFGVRGLGPEDKESEVSKLFEMLDSAAKGTLKDKTGKAVKVVLPKVDDSAPPVQLDGAARKFLTEHFEVSNLSPGDGLQSLKSSSPALSRDEFLDVCRRAIDKSQIWGKGLDRKREPTLGSQRNARRLWKHYSLYGYDGKTFTKQQELQDAWKKYAGKKGLNVRSDKAKEFFSATGMDLSAYEGKPNLDSVHAFESALRALLDESLSQGIFINVAQARTALLKRVLVEQYNKELKANKNWPNDMKKYKEMVMKAWYQVYMSDQATVFTPGMMGFLRAPVPQCDKGRGAIGKLMCFFFAKGGLTKDKMIQFGTAGQENLHKMMEIAYPHLFPMIHRTIRSNIYNWTSIKEVFEKRDSKTKKLPIEEDGFFELASVINELLALNKFNAKKRLQYIWSPINEEDEDCIKACRCGITKIESEVEFGITIGAGTVNLCTPDSNFFQFKRISHAEKKVIQTQQTEYHPLANGGFHTVEQPLVCRPVNDPDATFTKVMFTYAFGLEMQIDVWRDKNTNPQKFELSGDAFGFNFRFLLPLVPSEQNAEDLLKAEEGEPKFFKGLADNFKKNYEDKNNNILNKILKGNADTQTEVLNDSQGIKQFVALVFSGFTKDNGKYKSDLWNMVASKISVVSALKAAPLKALNEVLPVTVTLDQYIGLDISFSWPKSSTGKKNWVPDFTISMYTLNQRGVSATLGDMQLSATLGAWISDGYTISAHFNPHQSEYASAPNKGDVVEFWFDAADEADVEEHFIGTIEARHEPLQMGDDIEYTVYVKGRDAKGRLTDAFNQGVDPQRFNKIPHTRVRRLPDEVLTNGVCPSS